MSSFWLRIDGCAATEIAPHTPPTWETLANGGCGAASWAFALSPRAQHRALRPGAVVEILCGPVPVYRGVLTEPDRTTWECHAEGLSEALGDYLALNGTEPASDIQTAIASAIAAGWPGSNPAPLTGFVASASEGGLVTVAEMLEAYANQTGTWWGTNGFGALYRSVGESSPTWLTAPGAAAFGPTSENAPKMLAGRYKDTETTETYAFVGSGAPQAVVDLTGRGVLTATAAEAFLSGMLFRSGVTGWVNSVTLHREQLTTMGGTPAALAAVRAGQMVRVHGLGYAVGSGAPWLDVLIGKTVYQAGSDLITIEPINTAPRVLSDVIASA